jgi:aspartate carbamoyltransferase regulatory subunit
MLTVLISKTNKSPPWKYKKFIEDLYGPLAVVTFWHLREGRYSRHMYAVVQRAKSDDVTVILHSELSEHQMKKVTRYFPKATIVSIPSANHG